MRAVLLVVLLLASCKAKKDRYDLVLDDLTAFRDRVCACPAIDCIDKVMVEVRGYQETMRDRVGSGSATEDQERAGRKLQADMRDCRKKLADAKTPAP